MQVLIVLSVLGALAVADNAVQEPATHAVTKGVLALFVCALPILWAWAWARVAVRDLRRPDVDRGRALSKQRWVRRAHLVLWLAAAGFVLLALDWPRIVRFNMGLDGWVLIDELLVSLPVLVPLVLSWAAYHDVDRVLHESVAGPNRDGQLAADTLLPPRWNCVAFQARTVMGVALAPLLLLLLTQDIARLLAPGFMAGPDAWMVLLLPLLMLVVGFPVLLRHVWRTSPLPPGPLRTRLEMAARRFNLHVREILVWRTNGLLLNAAVAGFVPGLRYVFLTDSLLEQLNDDEIEAVFGHEVGHIRHRHVFLRALVLLAPICLWPLLQGSLDLFAPSAESLGAAHWTAAIAAGLALLFLLGLYIAAVFGYCSRRFERQADLFGCRVSSAGQAGRDANAAVPASGLSPAGIQTFIGALEKLALLNGVSRHAPSWQHGSIDMRVGFLEGVEHDPTRERGCHRQVRILGGVLVSAVLVGLIAPLLLNAVQAAGF
ncbi:MAG: M48 family metallopeptidase [Pirellulales bacterium]